jgi:hypothetical protein
MTEATTTLTRAGWTLTLHARFKYNDDLAIRINAHAQR